MDLTRKKKILLIYTSKSTFVKEDITNLSSFANVKCYQFKLSKNGIKLIWSYIRIILHLAIFGWKYDILFSWFAGFHSLVPFYFGDLFNKMNVVVVGGYDAVAIPNLNYGFFVKNDLRAFMVKKSFQRANIILPVDRSLIKGTNHYASQKPLPIGVKSFLPHINAKFLTIPTGYDYLKWKPIPGIDRKKAVITVAGANDEITFKRKGIDFLLEVAKEMPEVPFTIVGLRSPILEYARTLAPSNVLLLGYIQNNKLPEILSAHKVYIQPSLSEGLPNSLCEAMLCECIPVGSNVNGIPNAIGDTGFILQKKDIDCTVQLLKESLNSSPELAKKARQRIIANFTKQKRKKALQEILS